MAFKLPHSTLTQILGNAAPYDPKTETTPEFMNGKFSECLENDVALAQQINNLSGKFSDFNVVPTFCGGVGGGEGGEIHMSKAKTTQWSMDLVFDVCNDMVRFYTEYTNGLRIALIDFNKLKAGNNTLATTETISLGSITLLNGFQRYPDTAFGNISRSGNLVHVNILLAGNGAGNAAAFRLPFTPLTSEIHTCGAIEVRTTNDGYLNIMGTLTSSKTYYAIDLEYTCTGIV